MPPCWPPPPEVLHKVLPPKAVPLSPELIQETIRDALLFKGFQRDEKTAAATPQKFKRGQIIVREGEPGSEIYLVHSGRVEVLRDTPAGRPEYVATLERSDSIRGTRPHGSRRAHPLRPGRQQLRAACPATELLRATGAFETESSPGRRYSPKSRLPSSDRTLRYLEPPGHVRLCSTCADAGF
ncbi:MAG: cyclic nucleotide-binding domain-containing protein [Candidatus Synoicihabitans palmerolidicus]|nr:cyclic nucleotide-binding domain-containing protein [Candidatus Synoicihabitans palmerolidicus]